MSLPITQSIYTQCIGKKLCDESKKFSRASLFHFENSTYDKRKDAICTWLLCARRLHVVKDIRLLIAKMVIDDQPIEYVLGNNILSVELHPFVLVHRFNGFFNSYGLNYIWSMTDKRGLVTGYVPCPICWMPMSMLEEKRSPGTEYDYWTMYNKCVRHGVFIYTRPRG